MFAEREAPLLRPLPAEPYAHRTRKLATVHIDYHVELGGHYYSVPYHLVREKVELRFDARTVEVYHEGLRVALHLRSNAKGRATTDAAHMPETHRAAAAWTPRAHRGLGGTRRGPPTAALAAAHHGRPAAPRARLPQLPRGPAPRRASTAPRAWRRPARGRSPCGARSYRSVRSILERGLDGVAESAAPPPRRRSCHANVRGADYYD